MVLGLQLGKDERMTTETLRFLNSRFPADTIKQIVNVAIESAVEDGKPGILKESPHGDLASPVHWSQVQGNKHFSLDITRGISTRKYIDPSKLEVLDEPYDAIELMFGSLARDVHSWSISLWVYTESCTISISTAESTHEKIAKIANIGAEIGKILPTAETPSIFIGHGGASDSWQIVHNGLEKLFKVEAFESKPRSGLGIQNILKDFLETSNFAVLVFTAEDEQADESLRARQNVVHETGLFQGRHGFERVALLVEEGTVSFSNMDGLQYIPYRRGKVSETIPQIVEMVYREFPNFKN